jgi:hypothetical protein
LQIDCIVGEAFDLVQHHPTRNAPIAIGNSKLPWDVLSTIAKALAKKRKRTLCQLYRDYRGLRANISPDLLVKDEVEAQEGVADKR